MIVIGSFRSTAFAPGGNDLRGIVFSPDGNKAWVLHRDHGPDNPSQLGPAAVAYVDARPDAKDALSRF